MLEVENEKFQKSTFHSQNSLSEFKFHLTKDKLLNELFIEIKNIINIIIYLSFRPFLEVIKVEY
jgi:hypothetical protein